MTEVFRHIRVPYLILQGDTDIVTSTRRITEFVETGENDNIMVRCIKNSGHMPGIEAMGCITGDGFNFLSGK